MHKPVDNPVDNPVDKKNSFPYPLGGPERASPHRRWGGKGVVVRASDR